MLFVFIAVFFMSPIGGFLFFGTWKGAIAVIDGVGGLVGNPTIWEVIDAF